MTLQAVTHLNFRGDARDALAFYQTVFGGDLAVISYRDAGDVRDAADADRVMWGQVAAESGFRVMAYDVPSHLPWSRGEDPFFVSLRGDTDHEVTGYWTLLSVGANVLKPLAPAPWSPLYGMLRDRFGVTWVVDVAQRPDHG